MGAPLGRGHEAHPQTQPLDRVVVPPFLHEVVAGGALIHEIGMPVPAGGEGERLTRRGFGDPGDPFAGSICGETIGKIGEALLSEADHDVIDLRPVEVGRIEGRVVSSDDDQCLPAPFDFRGKAKHRIGLAGDGGESHHVGLEIFVLQPELRFVCALQVHDADFMGAERCGDDLEAEGFPLEYLPDGSDPVLLFGDRATGVGRVDQQYVHGPRPWWICRTAQRQERSDLYKMRYAVSMKSRGGVGPPISLSNWVRCCKVNYTTTNRLRREETSP